MVKIQPGMILTYNSLDPHPSRSDKLLAIQKEKKPLDKAYTGLLTAGSKKRLIKAINLLIAISRKKKAIHFDSKVEFYFRVNFITLTLPCAQADVTDKDLKLKCLKPWVEYWRDKSPGFAYVWRAERQQNGNLHFHLITNTYIHYKDIRDTWNKYLNAFHFINEFQRVHNHRDPNSTDVHAVKQIRNLAAYIAKYMSKKETEGQTIEGRVWDCSTNLKTKKSCAWPMGTDDFDTFSKIYNELPDNAFSTDHCTGIRMSELEMKKWFSTNWIREYKQYLNEISGA